MAFVKRIRSFLPLNPKKDLITFILSSDKSDLSNVFYLIQNSINFNTKAHTFEDCFEEIISSINDSAVVIIEYSDKFLTFYDLGLAEGMKKPILIISIGRQIIQEHFRLKGLFLNFKDSLQCIKTISKIIPHIITGHNLSAWFEVSTWIINRFEKSAGIHVNKLSIDDYQLQKLIFPSIYEATEKEIKGFAFFSLITKEDQEMHTDQYISFLETEELNIAKNSVQIIKELIAKNNIEEALKKLNHLSKLKESYLHDSIILLERRFYDSLQGKQNNTLSWEKFSLERSRISYELLQYCSKLDS